MERCLAGNGLRITLLAVLLGLAPLPGYGMSTPEWFYSVAVPVADQGADERHRASQVALLGVLTRVTGLLSIPRNSQINAALANPARFYNEFRFVEVSPTKTDLRVNFQKAAIIDLAKSAQLPVWWTQRPIVMAWVVIETQGERQILRADSEHPLAQALLQRGRARGLDVRLPIMDLDDHIAVTPGDVWGKVTSSLLEAAQRYQAEQLLVGRLRSNLTFRGRELQGDWTYWEASQPVVQSFDTPLFDEVAHLGVDSLADALLTRFSVLARDPQRWQVRIGGLAGITPLAELLRYLEGLDYLDGFDVTGMQSNEVTLVLSTRARAQQLVELLTVEGRLVTDNLYLGSGLRLIWRPDT